MMTKRVKPQTSRRAQWKANLLLLLSMAALAVAVAGTERRLPAAAAGAFFGGSPAVTGPSLQESEETLQLVIGDGGFEPAQVTRRPGKFLLTADDRRSDRSQRLTLRLSREGGEQLRDIEVPAGVTDWAEEIEVPVGRYVVGEVNHPTWSCLIVVE